ncbi:MAG TPA: hypothetical protein VG711_01765 [Phycisphaerales bacterium]|nr:hypothetical protein [Phycisphaerales bacterium]
MVELTSLWLPILLSAVAAFVISAVAWMGMSHHKGDFKPLPDQEGVRSALAKFNIPRGVYFFPHMKDCKGKSKEEIAAALNRGPVGMLNVYDASMFTSMGRNMALSFIFYIVTSVVVAYLASVTLPSGAGFAKVFQVAGTAGVLAYCFACIPGAIWFGTPLRNVLSSFVDGLVMGLATGAIFAWMWPAALVIEAVSGGNLSIKPH